MSRTSQTCDAWTFGWSTRSDVVAPTSITRGLLPFPVRAQVSLSPAVRSSRSRRPAPPKVPSAGVVVGAVAADAVAVLTLATRAVGHVALLYGYDPEDPAEKVFALTVVNVGTAVSASAKTAALADLSRLTQALVRGKSWDILNKSVVSKVTNQFAKAFGVRLTKKSLGKFVPVVGILLGGTFNWATLEGIIDAADVAYRRRFLIETYPHLLDEGTLDLRVVDDDSDEAISVLEELAKAGGPDLRGESGSERVPPTAPQPT